MLDKLVDALIPDKYEDDPNGNPSVDWCRFRRRSRCYYPKAFDYEAAKITGYAVWVPEDRGLCPRISWTMQRACPIGEPGPHSGDPGALLDATIPYSEGGQRSSS